MRHPQQLLTTKNRLSFNLDVSTDFDVGRLLASVVLTFASRKAYNVLHVLVAWCDLVIVQSCFALCIGVVTSLCLVCLDKSRFRFCRVTPINEIGGFRLRTFVAVEAKIQLAFMLYEQVVNEPTSPRQ